MHHVMPKVNIKEKKDMNYVNSTFKQKEKIQNLKFEMPDSFTYLYIQMTKQ
jgi:predicted transcriptional regulator